MKQLEPFYVNEPNIYSLPDFLPFLVDRVYLDRIGVTKDIDAEVLYQLTKGSVSFICRYNSCSVIPKPEVILEELCRPETHKLQIHNYTKRCPTLTYEVSPVKGCGVGCMYCLVSDGIHEYPTVVIENYAEAVDNWLEMCKDEEHYFYYSAKTEAFQEATLRTGLAHDLLRTFIRHYDKYPESKVRLFIASKAGVRHLQAEHEGETILDLMEQLKDKMQFNTSLAIMPEEVLTIFEPYAAPIIDRLEGVKLVRDRGVLADSALVQPILPGYIDNDVLQKFMKLLQSYGMKNFKPEFLTISMETLAWMGQIVNYFNSDIAREMFNLYVSTENQTHRKQRKRTAPNRDWCISQLKVLKAMGRDLGISTSICYWVRNELNIGEDIIPIINENGYQCLGYQRKLFDK